VEDPSPAPRLGRRAALGLATASLIQPARAGEAIHVPWSAGSEAPHLAVPPEAADCHHHIYDHHYPAAPGATLHPPDATIADYRLLQRRLGLRRHVIVQPSTYGTDNRLLLAALAAFGTEARGVAVLHPDVPEAELRRLDAAGVRGVRFNLIQAGATRFEMILPLARRIAAYGWHVQVNMTGEAIAAAGEFWTRLPTPVVFDHFGHVPLPAGTASPAFRTLAGLLEKGRAWVKLSGAYVVSQSGPPAYSDLIPLARAFVALAPERLVWGTDWPHPTERVKPDDAALLDLLAVWVPDSATRTRILVDNPRLLYGFS
jgi:predicted TIM-barrel fold metal-dependent hydrolase